MDRNQCPIQKKLSMKYIVVVFVFITNMLSAQTAEKPLVLKSASDVELIKSTSDWIVFSPDVEDPIEYDAAYQIFKKALDEKVDKLIAKQGSSEDNWIFEDDETIEEMDTEPNDPQQPNIPKIYITGTFAQIKKLKVRDHKTVMKQLSLKGGYREDDYINKIIVELQRLGLRTK